MLYNGRCIVQRQIAAHIWLYEENGSHAEVYIFISTGLAMDGMRLASSA